MGNQQSNAGAAKFFSKVTDVITAPVNVASTMLVGAPIVPSASAAVAASSDPNINSNAGGTFTAKLDTMNKLATSPPPNMLCRKVVGQDTPTFDAEMNNWYCGTGNDSDRKRPANRYGSNLVPLGPVGQTFYPAQGGIGGNNPTPGPTNEWTGGGALHNPPPGAGYSPNRGPQQQWESRPNDGVSPPSKKPRVPNSKAPQSDDPQQLNPQFNLSGSMDPGNKTVLGGDANSLSVAQGFPNLNASAPAPSPAAAVPAMDNTTLLMIGGAVVVGAVLLAKKK